MNDSPAPARIRAATLDDLEIILEHRVSMFRDMGSSDGTKLERVRRISREYFAAALVDGGYHAVLAEADGRVVGGGGVVIAAWPGSENREVPRRPWILNIYVLPEFRRRGIAHQVMDHLIEWCRCQGFDCVCLHASNEGRPLYEKLGFQPTNEMRLNF